MKTTLQFLKWMVAAVLLGCVVLHPAQQARAAAFTVNATDDEDDGTCDSAHCSLREAIAAANAADGTDTIDFDISGEDVHSIQPTSALPPVIDPIVIDGTTQPGYSDHPLIEIDGSAAGDGVNGLTIFAGGSTVKGLIINRFTFAGIFMGLGGGNTIIGNMIGTNADGTEAAGNRDGIYMLQSHNNIIGGTTPDARNVLSGNWDDGVNPNTSHGTIIQGNFIGTSADGEAAIGNSGDGIKIDARSNDTQIGANVIAYNAGRGVYMEAAGDNYGTGNAVLENEIYDNGESGIDLGGDGVTDNSDDAGPNNLQHYPILTSVIATGDGVTLEGTLGGEADLEYRLEFFANDSCGESGHGEGQAFVGAMSVTTDGSGEAIFSVDLAAEVMTWAYLTATATDSDNNTSEFSACLESAASA
jgi:CSLREA domain-containing protein